MNKILTLLLISITCYAKAQQVAPALPVPDYQAYGKVDIADLEMKLCDFEKEANAEVLFDVGTMDPTGVYIKHHIRVKIFNDIGKNEASVKILYYGDFKPNISDLKGETINLEDGKIVITPLDKKLVYVQSVDRAHWMVAFALPNVKAGSIIEYEMVQGTPGVWYFQSNLPERYSEINTQFDPGTDFRFVPHIMQAFARSEGEATDNVQVKALANVHSMPNEPYMTPRSENLQRMEYINRNGMINSWQKIGEIIMKVNDITDEFDRNIADAGTIIKHANTLGSDDEKIAYMFNQVRDNMKWSGEITAFPRDGIVRAWDKKTGNSVEINLIVYRLLKKAGINAYPLFTSTKDNGKLNPFNPNLFTLNNVVVYVPVDSSKYYILDATDKYNLYNTIPTDNLNTFALCLDSHNEDYKTIFIENHDPVIQSVSVDAEIKPDGKMTGTAQINSFGYNRSKGLEKYKTDGETKYIDYLTGGNSGLKIASFKMENMNADSLPLVQDISFNFDLQGSDDNYIYFNPNLFTDMQNNPFLSENRFTDIDFGYRDNMVLNGIYKIPAGYKVDALPKNTSMSTSDTSIVFRRIINEQDGTIVVRYVINHKKTIYFKNDYPEFHEFFKKLYELMNEQVVLKKS